MAMSLKDCSDTQVNATTFIRTSNAHLQAPRGSHSTQSVAAAGKACAPRRGSLQAKLALHRGAQPSCQQSAQLVGAES
jgi:hypothetical protein